MQRSSNDVKIFCDVVLVNDVYFPGATRRGDEDCILLRVASVRKLSTLFCILFNSTVLVPHIKLRSLSFRMDACYFLHVDEELKKVCDIIDPLVCGEIPKCGLILVAGC